MFKLLKSIFKINEKIDHSYNKGVVDGTIKERERVSDQRMQSIYFEIERLVGKAVYTFGNEWEDPVVGVGVGIVYLGKLNEPFLKIHNYITGEDTIGTSKVYTYTKLKFEALYKLDPYERWSLIKDTNGVSSVPIENTLFTKEEVIELLTVNGFYDLDQIKNEPLCIY